MWAEELGLPTVPVLGKNLSLDEAREVWGERTWERESEGFTIRNADAFHYADFNLNLVKYVREGHVQTSDNWRGRTDFERNALSGS